MGSTEVYLNNVVTANPPNDVQAKFVELMPQLMPDLSSDPHKQKLFSKLASKAHIDHRYSVLKVSENPGQLDAEGFYAQDGFATTAQRMEKYKSASIELSQEAVAKMLKTVSKDDITHLIVTSCTGFFAPGLDLILKRKFEMRSDLERITIGFMGCYAGINSLKTAAHIVRSQPLAKVLIVNIEICSIHLQPKSTLEEILGSMQFGDGCAVSLVSQKREGLRLDRFRCDVRPEHEELIQWHIGDSGFNMFLSPLVPAALGQSLPKMMETLFNEKELSEIQFWAIHPGGRSILDVAEDKLKLPKNSLLKSREVLRRFGNMSSATLLYVLRDIMTGVGQGNGLAMAFGPGLTVETMGFSKLE